MPSTLKAQGPLLLREKLCFGSGDFASNLYWSSFGTYLLFFYTDVFGIPAGAAGTLCLIAWLLDGALNPFMGMIADRTETRWGKFRPYLLWIGVPLTVLVIMTYTTPHFSTGGKLVWAYSTYVPVMILFAALSVPYAALLGVISSDPRERASLVSIKFVFAYAANMIVAGSLLPMTRALGGSDAARGWQLSFAVYGIAFLIIICFTFFGTRERLRPVPRSESTMKKDLRDLMGNRPWIFLALITIFYITAVNLRGIVTPHYFKYFVGSQSVSIPFTERPRTFSFIELVSAVSATGQIASVLGVLSMNWFVGPIGKKQAIIILATVSLVSNAVFFVLNPDQLAAIFLFNLLGSLSSAPLFALVWSMFADVADYSEWRTGRRATGLVFAGSLMCTKIGGALASAGVGWVLGWIGFQPNVAESPAVLRGLVLLMSLFPAAIGVIYLIVALYYPLNEKRLAEIEVDLRVRRVTLTDATTILEN
jgi:glycoside/pentoside/hexuronide:cation symporter, GPH family